MPVDVRSSLAEPGLRYLEQRAPIVFPESGMPVTEGNFDIRVLLYQFFRDSYGNELTVGSDEYVYFDAEDPKQNCAPDLIVRRCERIGFIDTWKVWERGAPEIVVELISASDSTESAWQTKMARSRRFGASEVVRFDPNDRERPLRIWDRVQGPLVERVVEGTSARSLLLDLEWIMVPADTEPRALRIVRDGKLVPTRLEVAEQERQARAKERQTAEQERQTAEQERQTAEQERQTAEQRIRELEAELARRL